MRVTPSHTLGAASVGVSLAAIHYGMGFIIGTSEKSFIYGPAGSLYPVSAGLGLAAIMVFARIYWKEQHPIWTLLGDQYGSSIKRMVSMLSVTWMIGAIASQILGAAFIMKSIGVSKDLSMITATFLIIGLSVIKMERFAALFKVLLGISSLAFVYTIWELGGFHLYATMVGELVPSLSQIGVGEVLGISLNTVVLTSIGMDFHQFVVRAKNVKTAYIGCIIGASMLLFMAFLPTAVVVGARESQILPLTIDGKESIPLVFLWVGHNTAEWIGFFLVGSLLIAAVGSGSCLNRISGTTIADFLDIKETRASKMVISVGTGVLCLFIALTAKTIVGLIVSFYAIYISGVLVPFLVYICQKKDIITVNSRGIYISLLAGGLSSLGIMIVNRAAASHFLLVENLELTMVVFGIGASVVGLVCGQILGSH
jgi:SSS family solute:Na+ symporter